MQKGQTALWMVVGVLIVAVIVGGAYYLGKNSSKEKDLPNQVACTQDAKVCPDGSSVGRVGPNCEFAECPTEEVDETANWKTYTNQQLNYQIKYPPDAKLIDPTWNTIAEKPSDVIIKNDFDLECVDRLGKENPDTYVECSGESVDIFVFSNIFKTAQQIAEEDKKDLDLKDNRCTINTINLGINNLIASELTGCLVSGSSFYYLEGTDNHRFKIGVSDNKDPKTKQILSSFQIINPDIIYKECKVGKDDELKDQCPQGYKCEFTGEYPDEVNNQGSCVRL